MIDRMLEALERLVPLVPSLGPEELGDDYMPESVDHALCFRTLPRERRRQLWVFLRALLGSHEPAEECSWWQTRQLAMRAREVR
jgi:hypothetical protein